MRLTLAALLAVLAFGGVSGASTQTVRPGTDLDPAVSPDGRWLLFQRVYWGTRYTPTQFSLWIAGADGTAERELVPPKLSMNALWTPDALIQVRHSEGETLLLRPEDGSVMRSLATTPAAWSPDGRWVAYIDRSPDEQRLMVAAPDGSSARSLVSVPNPGIFEIGSFSPDSTRLSYAVGGPRRTRAEVVGLDGTGRHVLREAGLVSPGKWSPDARALVVTAQEWNESPRVYVVHQDGSNARTLAPGSATSPDWSPTGGWIVYIRQKAVGKKEIYELMMARASGKQRRLVARTWRSGATWLADGRRVLTVGAGACRRSGVIEIDVFTRTVKRLTNRCRINGTAQSDDIRGTPLRDLIDGRGGADRIVGGSGADRISGGTGGDTIISKDRYRDTVDCGPGFDHVLADHRDRIARDCERARR